MGCFRSMQFVHCWLQIQYLWAVQRLPLHLICTVFVRQIIFQKNKKLLISIFYHACILFIFTGILSAQILGLKELLGTADLWPALLAFTAVPSVIQLCTLPFFPESPRCLLIDRNNEEKSKKGNDICLQQDIFNPPQTACHFRANEVWVAFSTQNML